MDEEPAPTKVRSYVSLNLDKAEAIATEAFHKAKEVITDSVNQVRETVKSVTEGQGSPESNFTDLTALQKEAAEKTEENAESPAESAPAKEASSAEADGPKEETVSDAKTQEPEKKTAPSGQVEEFFDDTP